MQLKASEDAFFQRDGWMEPDPQDAWLNDIAPTSQLSTRPGSNSQDVPLSQRDTYTLLDHAEFLSQQDTIIQTVPQLTRRDMRGDQTLLLLAEQDTLVHAVPRQGVATDPGLHLPETSIQIKPGHHLWPMLLGLSERIWQELHQKAEPVLPCEPAMVEHVRGRCLELLRADSVLANQIRDLVEAEQLLQQVVDEVLGYGPLEALLANDEISEITVTGPRLLCIVRKGELDEMPGCFEDEPHMLRIIENMLHYNGQQIEAGGPLAEMRLLDGSCVSIAKPPYAVNGPTIAIRKRSRSPLSMEDLVRHGSLSKEMADFLSACVQARLNIIVCGDSGSGKTTLMNALASCIVAEERIVVVEDVTELQLSQRHLVALALRPPNPGSAKPVTLRDLVAHALLIRPEYIMLGECRSDEVVELIQAMYCGRDGVLTTLYASNLRDCLTRLEVLCLAGGMSLPLTTIRAQLAGALDIIVHVASLHDDTYKVMNIAEVQVVEDDVIKLQSIYHYAETEVDVRTGLVQGMFRTGGFRPRLTAKIEAAGIHLPQEMFVPPLVAHQSVRR